MVSPSLGLPILLTSRHCKEFRNIGLQIGGYPSAYHASNEATPLNDSRDGTSGLRNARWWAVLIGAVAGLFFNFLMALLVFLGALLMQVAQTDLVPLAILALSLFAGLAFAGYVAGRLTSDHNPGFHGNLAGMALYAIVAVLGIFAGSPVNPFTLTIFSLVAAIIGFAGGVLGGRPRSEPQRRSG